MREASMSSPVLRRADRGMTEERSLAALAAGFSGHLATVGADGYPYCIPLLYIWMDGELYLHTASARGHLRSNVEINPRVCRRARRSLRLRPVRMRFRPRLSKRGAVRNDPHRG